jgi:uncharacterized membrane protein YhfC
MVNALLLLSPIGMIIVGLAAILFWKSRKRVAWKYFGYGALLWTLAIIPKIIMDITVSPYLYAGLLGYGTAALLIGLGMYLGLRTGLFESGFTWLAARKVGELKRIKLDDAMAFGIGFGSFEAIFLGITSFISLSLFIFNPSAASLLTEAQLASLDSPTIIVGAAILERVFAISIHAFASLLVFYSLTKRKMLYLAYSIIFKTVVDGIIPGLTYSIDTSTVAGIYLIEVPFLALAIIGYVGTLWLMKRYPAGHLEAHKAPASRRKAKASRKK